MQITLYFKLCLGEAGGDCTSCIVLFGLLHVLSLCLLHNMNTCSACTSPLINQWINNLWVIIFPSLLYEANAVCYCCKDVLRSLRYDITSKVFPLCWKSRDRADPWTAFKTQLSWTRRKFKLTKLERKKIHYYKDKLCVTWYRCFHRRPSSDE